MVLLVFFYLFRLFIDGILNMLVILQKLLHKINIRTGKEK